MSNQPAPSQSQNSVVPKSNGEDKTPPLETETQPPYPPRKKFVLEDFSQQAINRGQQKINAYVVGVDKEIVKALREVCHVFAKCCHEVDLRKLEEAIDKVSAATDKIAGEFPPGCTYPT